MKRAIAIDTLGHGLILAWIGFSVFFAWADNGDLFQRMGSFGVAVGLLYFAFIRHGPEFPKLLQDRFRCIRKTQHMHAQNIEGAYRNASLIAYELKKLRAELKLPESEIASGLANPLIASMSLSPIDAKELDERFEQADADEADAANRVEYQKRFSKMFEVWVVVISTFQWGFGDLFFSSICEAPC